MREPSFFFGGFPKCGTTALDLQLRQHPDILMADPKEPNIFGDHFGDSAYLARCYANGEGSVLGDATTYYFGRDHIAARIRERQPDARFIVCVRDPIDRTVSHYDHLVERGKETRPLSTVLRLGPRTEILRMSMYHSCIRPFWDTFGPNRFLFVHIDDVGSQQTMDAICAFLGVAPIALTPVVANVGAKRRNATLSRALVTARSIGLPSVLPAAVKDALRPALVKAHRAGRATGTTQPDAEDRASMRELFVPEMRAFRDLTGVSFPGW
jgi:hypothetical protein